MSKYTPIFEWDSEKGIASCILTNGTEVFIGIATCADQDRDLMSEKTGCEIAMMRAEIKYYIHVRDHELKPALAALKQLYYSMNRSKQYTEKSYENRMLYRQIKMYEADIAQFRTMIEDKKQELKDFIYDKDKFYKRVRSLRKGNNN